jgi:hypothetical protein
MLEVNEGSLVSPGDVFAVKLPSGMYAAVRVLRKVAKSSLVSTSQYLGSEHPSVDEPLVFKTLMEKRFFFGGMPARKWLDGLPPKCFEFVGNIPPTKAEAEMECLVYGGKWAETSGNEAFLEWRWIHDRPAFEEEVRKQQEEFERRRLPQKPKKMMSEEEFWAVIKDKEFINFPIWLERHDSSMREAPHRRGFSWFSCTLWALFRRWGNFRGLR